MRSLRRAGALLAGLMLSTVLSAQVGPIPGYGPLPLQQAVAACTPVVTNIGGASNATTSPTLTLTGVTVPAGSLIVVLINEAGVSNESGGTVSDGVNTYSSAGGVLVNNTATNVGFLNTFFAINASLSSGTITYTKGSASSRVAITAVYASNVVTSSALDTSVTRTAFGSNATSPSVTSGLPGQIGELFVGGLAYDRSTQTASQDTTNGWSSTFTSEPVSISAVFGGTQVNSGTSSKTYAPVLTGQLWAANVLSFKHC